MGLKKKRYVTLVQLSCFLLNRDFETGILESIFKSLSAFTF
jgi:hypothetical protein